jgi:hypothetical protein
MALIYDYARGIAYEDNTDTMSYAEDYFAHYKKCEGTQIANALNEFRVGLSHKYCKSIIDIGVGSGEFLKSCRIPCNGYDVNPVAEEWLKECSLWADPYAESWRWDGMSLWDVIEHIPAPGLLFSRVPVGAYVFLTIPFFYSLDEIVHSKHYKPTGEHLRYFTRDGFVMYMDGFGFDLLEESDAESKAGRHQVMSFAFKKR